MSLRVDKIYERRIVWDKLLADRTSDPYGQLSYEAIRAVSISQLAIITELAAVKTTIVKM